MQEQILRKLLNEMSLDDKIAQLLQISGGSFGYALALSLLSLCLLFLNIINFLFRTSTEHL